MAKRFLKILFGSSIPGFLTWEKYHRPPEKKGEYHPRKKWGEYHSPFSGRWYSPLFQGVVPIILYQISRILSILLLPVRLPVTKNKNAP